MLHYADDAGNGDASSRGSSLAKWTIAKWYNQKVDKLYFHSIVKRYIYH